MYKFIKYFLIVWIILFFFIPIVSQLQSEESTGPNDYARITDVDYKAELVDEPGEGGKVVITETLTYDVHAASKNNLFWELWRDLPEDYVDGLKIDYQVNYVKQLNEDGTETVYTESPKLYWLDSDYTSETYGPGKWYHSVGPYDEDLARYECVFFYVNGLYREEVTFEIQYEMHNAALRYADVSELYLTMYSEDTIKHLESFEGEILIPQKDMPKEGNYLAHTYGTNSHTFDYTESDTKNPGYHTFSFHLDKEDLQFKNYNQYLEFSLLAFHEDRHIFTEYAPTNYYSYDVYLDEALEAIEEYDQLPIEAKNNKKILFFGSIIISILIFIFIINRDKNIRKKQNLYQPSTNIKYFRDIPSNSDPYFAATLVFCKNNHKVDVGDSYSALLLNLVRKGYIELQRIDESKDWVTNNILLKVLYDPSFNQSETMSSAVIQSSDASVTPTSLNSLSPDIKSNLGPTSIPQTSNQSLLFNSTPSTQTTVPIANQSTQVTVSTINQPTQIIERYNINGKKLEKLSSNEESYFNLITKHALGNSISMKEFQQKVSSDYDNTDTFVTSIENSIVNIGISQGYFQKADYCSIKNHTNSLAKTYIVLSLLILIVGNFVISHTRLDFAYGSLFILGFVFLISGLILKRSANKYVLLTQFGEEEYMKWRALYNFLNSETLMKERTVIELPLWEEYLVYATAFGISNKVIKALELRCPDVTNSSILNNSYYRSRSFRTSGHSFRSSTYRASSVSRSFRYSSSSYYGGGGRGGGGGGGGH